MVNETSGQPHSKAAFCKDCRLRAMSAFSRQAPSSARSSSEPVEMHTLLSPLDRSSISSISISHHGSFDGDVETDNSNFNPHDQFTNDLEASKVSNADTYSANKINGRHALHMAVIRNSSQSVVSALIRVAPESVKVADIFGRLPLHYAVEHSVGDDVVMSLLGEYPAAASLADKSGRLPLHLAVVKSRSDAVLIALLDAHPKAASVVSDSGRLPLHDAALHVSSEAVIAMLLTAHPQAASARDHESQLPLHEAAGHNNVAVVIALLAAHPDAAASANSSGCLPLHEAARRSKSPDVCAALLKAFPDAAQFKDKNGRSPLHLAVAFNKNMDIFSHLLNFYPDASKLTDNHGRHPLHDAAASSIGSDVIVSQLLKFHPHAASVADHSGLLPLFHAARHCKADVIFKALLSVYPEAAEATNTQGQLPLHVAAGCSKSSTVISLLLNSNPNASKHPNKFGRLPLHEAARLTDSPDIIRAIFEAYPAAATVPDADGCVPLHYAMSVNQHDAVPVELLVMCSEAAKISDQNGRLPLELASHREGNLIAALLSAHPDAFFSLSFHLQHDISVKLSLADDLIQVILRISDHPLYTSLHISAILYDFQKEQRALNVQLANGADEQSARLEQFACAIARSISSQHLESGGKEFDACLRFGVDRKLKFFVGEATCNMRMRKLWRNGYNDDHWLLQLVFYLFLNAFVHMRSKYPPPRIRFYFNRICYLIFLFALITLPIIETRGQSIKSPAWEVFLLHWLFSIIYAEARDITNFIKDRRYTLSFGLKKYYSDPWSVYDVVSFVVAAAAALVRILLYFDSAGNMSLSFARQLYAWALALLWGRLVNVLAAVPFIGPLLIMVLRMVFKDLTRFFILAVLVEMPFVVALYYLENGKVPASSDFDTLAKSTASFFRISIAQGPILQDLFGSSWALFATGSVLLGVLLLNLLIAMFSKTFDVIVENSTQEYLLQKAELTFFWARSSRMPPPMSIILSLRDLVFRKLGSRMCTGKVFREIFTDNYQQKSHVTFEFDKKAFHKIFPFNKGTQKYKLWINKVMDDLEQNGEFNSEAHMNEFKSRMLKGIHKLNSNAARTDTAQRLIKEGSSRVDRKIEQSSSLKTIEEDDQVSVAQKIGLSFSPAGGAVSAFDDTRMAGLQKQIHDEGQKLDRQVQDLLKQLSEQKMQSGNQLDLLQEKVFVIHAAQKQLQDASLKQFGALEGAWQATEQKLDRFQKRTDERLQEMHDLLHQVLTRLGV